MRIEQIQRTTPEVGTVQKDWTHCSICVRLRCKE